MESVKLERKMLTVIVDGEPEPIGFVDITNRTTLSEARLMIESELEGVPSDFRFLLKSPGGLVARVSLMQESKKMAIEFAPIVTIKPNAQFSSTGIPIPSNTDSLMSTSPISSNKLRSSSNEAVVASGQAVYEPTTDNSAYRVPSPMKIMSDLSKSPNSIARHLANTIPGPPSTVQNHVTPVISVTDIAGMPRSDQLLQEAETIDKLNVDVLWKSYFGNQSGADITLDQLPFAVTHVVGKTVDANSEYYKALVDLVINMGPNAYSRDDEDSMEDPKEVFTRILKSFGPLKDLLDRIVAVLKLSYFHGNISSATAESLIKNQPVGTFLVRLSNSQPGSFAITVRPKDTQLLHYIIERTPDFQYKLGREKYSSLDEVIKKNAQRLKFKTPCPNWPFARTFKIPDLTQGYSEFES